MKTFNSLDQFTKHLDRQIAKFEVYEIAAAEFLGKTLEKEAKDKIGHLQEGSGPFPQWHELAESTKQGKERKGAVFNADANPLYVTGELRDSIGSVFFKPAHVLFLGSNSEIMVYQEKGTMHIPARSVLGLTMFQATAEIKYTFGSMLQSWIAGEPLRLRRHTHGSI